MLEAMGLGLWAPPAARADEAPERRAPASLGREPPQAGSGAARASVAPVAGTRCAACPRRMAPLVPRGAAQPAWLVVGGAPEGDDVADGRPFAGAAGELLQHMLRAVGISLDDASGRPGARVALAVRCAPVDGRVPDAAQLAACAAALHDDLAATRPRVVLALGRTAAQALLGSGDAVGRWRGSVHRAGDAAVVVTHELRYLLRHPEAKAEAWDDLCLARAAFDGAGPAPSGA
jgi:DNA polymerase